MAVNDGVILALELLCSRARQDGEYSALPILTFRSAREIWGELARMRAAARRNEMRKSLLWTTAGLIGYAAVKRAMAASRALDLRGKNVVITGASRGLG